jgi:hypothetical protein
MRLPWERNDEVSRKAKMLKLHAYRRMGALAEELNPRRSTKDTGGLTNGHVRVAPRRWLQLAETQMTKDERYQLAQKLTRELIDRGKLVEAGWATMRVLVLPKDVSSTQVSEMRKAFFMGAEHVFTSIMTMLEMDREPTPLDFQRLDNLQNELEAFKMGSHEHA